MSYSCLVIPNATRECYGPTLKLTRLWHATVDPLSLEGSPDEGRVGHNNKPRKLAGTLLGIIYLGTNLLRSPSPTPCSKQELLETFAQHIISWVLNLQIPHLSFTTSCKVSVSSCSKRVFSNLSPSPLASGATICLYSLSSPGCLHSLLSGISGISS